MGRRRPLVRRGNSMKSLKNKLKLTLRFRLGGQVNGVTDRERTQEGFTLHPIISSPHCSSPQSLMFPDAPGLPNLLPFRAYYILAERTFSPSCFTQPGFKTSGKITSLNIHFHLLKLETQDCIHLKNSLFFPTDFFCQNQIHSVMKLSGHPHLPPRYWYLNQSGGLTQKLRRNSGISYSSPRGWADKEGVPWIWRSSSESQIPSLAPGEDTVSASCSHRGLSMKEGIKLDHCPLKAVSSPDGSRVVRPSIHGHWPPRGGPSPGRYTF